MNINRQNYEEFFLMYVDNELTEAQRTQVEAFVQQNPDLTEELMMLQESVLPADEITFTGKESLYKNENAININNYEEFFLLDVDNELSAGEKADVEKFVLQHPKLQDEYTLLHQTKLPLEVVEFKNKEILYKTEEKERRVIPMRFMKLAVAASVIGLIATLWIVYPNKTLEPQVAATTEKPATKSPGKAVVEEQQPSPTEVAIVDETNNITPAVVAKNSNERRTTVKEIIETPTNRVTTKTAHRADEQLAYSPIEEPSHKEIDTRTYNTTKTVETGLAINASSKSDTETSYARPAVYKEVDDDDDEKSFLIGSAEINKNKLRGLLKKAATLFDKKAKTNDSERTIQIASFEIKTK